jgi:TRAP-type C4-dicarboxylate transport system substrate-binding protein
MERMIPVLNEEFEENGFKTLFWMHTGWIYLFSRDRVVYPKDLYPQKMWAGEGDEKFMEAWRRMGCIPVPFSTEDAVIQFQTKGVDALISSPLWILSVDLYNITNNMNSLKWAPFPGAIAIDIRIWERINSSLRNELEEAAAEIADSMKDDWFDMEDDAIETMERYGLVINNVPENAYGQWEDFINTGYIYVLENNYDMRYYNMAVDILDEYRNSH